ncbi:MAG: crosslink repair DNA glycosylase YcaQ family protein, partial [archaeon]
GVTTNGMGMSFITSRAEQEGIICSGPLKGNQFTYALLDERAASKKTFSREEGLGKLAWRYFSGHGPATLRDFSWWSGLSLGDARLGLQGAEKKLKKEEWEGNTYYFDSRFSKEKEMRERVWLLPNYDEYTIGYWSKGALYLSGKNPLSFAGGYYHAIVKGGMVEGMWRRETKKDKVIIRTHLAQKLSSAENESFKKAVREYSLFLEKECESRNND